MGPYAMLGLPPHDSVNQWPMLTGRNATAPRTEIVIGDTSALGPNADGKTLVGGVIQGRWKLLLGAADELHTVSQYAPHDIALPPPAAGRPGGGNVRL